MIPALHLLALSIWGWTLLPLLVLVAVWALFVLALYVGGGGGGGDGGGARAAARALARLIPDLVVLFKRLLGDSRVPAPAKIALVACVGYLLLPFDLVPDFIPVAGQIDDAILVALVLRYALGSTGPALVTELWPGPPESLAVVLRFAGRRERSRVNLVWALAFGLVLPLIAFLMLAEDVWEREVFDWDTPVLRFLDTHQDATLTLGFRVVTQFGGSALVTALVGAALGVAFIARLRREAAFLLLAVGGAGVLNVLLKGFFDRPRPEVFPHLVQIASSSFPSGHTMSSMALALAIVVLLRRSPYLWLAAAMALGYALVVGGSRLYLGVHFPSDVVAGWCASIAWVTIAWLLVIERPWRGRSSTTEGYDFELTATGAGATPPASVARPANEGPPP